MAAYCTGIRICILNRWKSVKGWGFRLHSALRRHGARYLAAVQPYSPAACTGLRPGDRIVEVNYANICHAEHDEVVHIMNSCEDTMMLLVVDAQTDIAYQNMQKCIHSRLSNILLLTCPKTEPERDADDNLKLPPASNSSVSDNSSTSLTCSATSWEYVVPRAAQPDVNASSSADRSVVGGTSLEGHTTSSMSGEYVVQEFTHRDVEASLSSDSSSVGGKSLESLTCSSTSGEYYVQTTTQRDVDAGGSIDSSFVSNESFESLTSSSTSGEYYVQTTTQSDVNAGGSIDSSFVSSESFESLTSSSTFGEYYVQSGRLKTRSGIYDGLSKAKVRRSRAMHKHCAYSDLRKPHKGTHLSPCRKHYFNSLFEKVKIDSDSSEEVLYQSADLRTGTTPSERPAESELNATGVADQHDTCDGKRMPHLSVRRRHAFRRRNAGGANG